jgi:5-(aminomethyl)-3-furanmethanol phosphate kinase
MTLPQTGLCDVFMKLGGSILDDDAATAKLVPCITSLSRNHRIMILTGGGRVVKRIKARQKQHGTDFHTCWTAAVRCLDVNAGILASYSKSFRVVTSAGEMAACFDAGHVAVFSPSGAIFHSLHLKPDWLPTTDSMGLFFASLLGARRYVIVSDVHGIYERKPDIDTAALPLISLSAEDLERLPSSKLDPLFPAYFRRYEMPTIIVSGLHPDRVSSAICGTPTTGTQISARRVS